MSPFSLPVMQMGFDQYIELIYEQPERFKRLMEINEKFCVDWANAQLACGATAICYFDPVSSTTVIDPQIYQQTGYEVAKRDDWSDQRPNRYTLCVRALFTDY